MADPPSTTVEERLNVNDKAKIAKPTAAISRPASTTTTCNTTYHGVVPTGISGVYNRPYANRASNVTIAKSNPQTMASENLFSSLGQACRIALFIASTRRPAFARIADPVLRA
jgi:hypothetical protein